MAITFYVLSFILCSKILCLIRFVVDNFSGLISKRPGFGRGRDFFIWPRRDVVGIHHHVLDPRAYLHVGYVGYVSSAKYRRGISVTVTGLWGAPPNHYQGLKGTINFEQKQLKNPQNGKNCRGRGRAGITTRSRSCKITGLDRSALLVVPGCVVLICLETHRTVTLDTSS